MTALQCLGAGMMALPLVALFAYCVRDMGWREAILIFLFAFGVCAFIACGAFLLAGSPR